MSKVKMTYCKYCGNRIEAKLKNCPACGGKIKKPFYTRAWFIILVLIIVIGAIGAACGNSKTKASKGSDSETSVSINPGTALQTPSADSQTPTSQAAVPSAPPAETAAPAAASQNGIRPEIKEAIDGYEAFVDEYCEFMKTYNSSDVTMLLKYTELLSKEIELSEKFEEIDDKDLTDAEALYYSEVSLRCSQKLLTAANNMK